MSHWTAIDIRSTCQRHLLPLLGSQDFKLITFFTCCNEYGKPREAQGSWVSPISGFSWGVHDISPVLVQLVQLAPLLHRNGNPWPRRNPDTLCDQPPCWFHGPACPAQNPVGSRSYINWFMFTDRRQHLRFVWITATHNCFVLYTIKSLPECCSLTLRGPSATGEPCRGSAHVKGQSLSTSGLQRETLLQMAQDRRKGAHRKEVREVVYLNETVAPISKDLKPC